MTESFSTRVGRIISGTVNQLIDAAEDLAPEMVLEQAQRELDQAMHDVRAELGKVEAQSHLATQRLADENGKHVELSDKIRLAISQGRDDLAEAATKRLLDIEAQIPVLENTLVTAGERRRELEAYIAALAGRKREMAEEIARFRASRNPGPGQASPDGGDIGARTGNRIDTAVDRANSAFERVLERTAGTPGSGRDIGDMETEKNLAELNDLAEKARIQDRLARFRREEG